MWQGSGVDLPQFYMLGDDLLVPRMLSAFQCEPCCRVINNNRFHTLTLSLNQDLLARPEHLVHRLAVSVCMEGSSLRSASISHLTHESCDVQCAGRGSLFQTYSRHGTSIVNGMMNHSYLRLAVSPCKNVHQELDWFVSSWFWEIC